MVFCVKRKTGFVQKPVSIDKILEKFTRDTDRLSRKAGGANGSRSFARFAYL